MVDGKIELKKLIPEVRVSKKRSRMVRWNTRDNYEILLKECVRQEEAQEMPKNKND